jgi:hypothetical protein
MKKREIKGSKRGLEGKVEERNDWERIAWFLKKTLMAREQEAGFLSLGRPVAVDA